MSTTRASPLGASTRTGTEVDLVVVGAGIVGLAHAVAAVERGLTVHVIDRDERAVGASVRNFGHVGVSAQFGLAFDFADAGRATWLRMAGVAGFSANECGAVVLARAADELAVLEEFAAERHGYAEVLDARGVAERVPITNPDVIGGAWLPRDLRVDQRRAVGAIAAWLVGSRQVTFSWATSLVGLEPGLARTSRNDIRARHIVVCVGHDVDRILPDVATEAGLRRCRLHMLQVDNPTGRPVEPAVLTGLSLLRYPGFSRCPSAEDVRARVTRSRPDLLDAAVNLMFTQRPDGSLVIGDTHADALTHTPFASEDLDRLLLDEAAALLGVGELAVRSRWRGVYATAEGDFLIAAPQPGTRVVSVTSGIGMTTAFGLAPYVLDGLLA